VEHTGANWQKTAGENRVVTTHNKNLMPLLRRGSREGERVERERRE
jgi:hypothetical protein